MSEIDFINQDKKSSKQKKDPEKSADIEYSKPKDEGIDFTAGTPRKKSFFEFFNSQNSGSKRKEQKPVFGTDRANKELWKKVVDKKPEKPLVQETQPEKNPASPVPQKPASGLDKSEGIFSFLKSFSTTQVPKPETENISEKGQSREVEQILLSKSFSGAKKTETAKSAKETAPNRLANGQKEPDELDILQTNLIKDQSLGFVDWRKKLNPIILTAVFSVFIIALAYGGITYWGIKNIEKTKINTQELLEMEKNIDLGMSRVQKDQVLVSEKKFPAVKYLIENHIYWTKLFKFLEDNTLDKVYFSGFSGDTSGSYTLGAQAESVKAAAEQIKALSSSDWVLHSTTYGISVGSSGTAEGSNLLADNEVKFSITLNLKPNIFKDYITISD